MIGTQTQPNVPYMWALTSAIKREADKLLADKQKRGSSALLGASDTAVSLQPDGVAGTKD